MLHLLWEHSAILLTFIKLPFDMKIFVLSIFEWPFYTGITAVPELFACWVIFHAFVVMGLDD